MRVAIKIAQAQVLPLVAAMLCATAASAQDKAASLEECLRSLFSDSPAFRAYGVQTREADAVHLRSQGAFDVVASAGVLGSRALWSAPYGGLTDQGYNDVAVQGSVATRTTDNVSVQIGGSTPVASSISQSISPDQPQVTANLTIPLLKFGPSAAFGAEERATGLHATAAAALQEDSESHLAAQLAEDYWRWVGSHEQLELARRLETLATAQLGDVDQLIEQRARATVDRLPFVAAAADAAASRTEAEQLMIDQQQALWEALGVAPPTNAVSPSAALPEVPGAPSEINPTVSRAHQLAQRRPLLAYWTREVAAAAARVDGAEVGRRPDVNVVAQVTAARVENAVVTTNTQLGYYGTVGLQFALPLQNRAANGAYELAAQTYAETSLAAQQQRNAIDVEIDALCSALTNLVRSYRERARATAQYELAYAAERQKFRLGTATSMDVVVAQRQYMVASLAVVAEHTTYAIVLARLLHQAGALSAAVHARDAAAVAHALTTSTF